MKMISKQILKSIAISALLTPLGMGLLFLLHLVLAKQLSPTDFGKVSYALSASAMIVIFLSSGIPISAQKFIPKYLTEKNILYLRGYIFWSFAWTIFSSLIAILCILIILNAIENNQAKETLSYISISIFPLALWFWQRYISLGFNFITIALIPREFFYPIFSILFLLLFNITNALYSLLLINFIYTVCIIGGIICISIYIPLKIKENPKILYDIKHWHVVSLPMLFSSMMLLGLNNWDLLILGFFVEMKDVGIYAIALKLSLVISMILRILNSVIGQNISTHFYNKDYATVEELFKKSRILSFLIALLSLIILILFSKFFLSYIGDEYSDAGCVLLILATGQFISALFGPVTICLNMVGEQKASAKILLMWSLIALILNMLLIPFLSLYGAAIANALTIAGMKLQQFLYFNKLLHRLTDT